MIERTYSLVETADQVTDEILEIVRQIESGWYAESRIDWEDVFSRVETTMLTDGTYPDLGNEADSPAMRLIKRVINRERRYS